MRTRDTPHLRRCFTSVVSKTSAKISSENLLKNAKSAPMEPFFGILAIATTSLVLSACSVAHLSNFQFGASPSPEVNGPGKDLDGVSMARVSASRRLPHFGFIGIHYKFQP